MYWRVKTAMDRAKKSVLRKLGYKDVNWLRVRQLECWREFLTDITPLDGLEISPASWSSWKPYIQAYSSESYPTFDICQNVLHKQFEVVIADQVIEHVKNPLEAVRNMRAMTKPDGWVMVSAPLLFRIHARPHDYWRWTPAGLGQLMVDAGFARSQVWADGWGNAACVRAHTSGPVKDYGFKRPMQNEPEYTVMTWALARNSPAETHTRTPYAGAEIPRFDAAA
jgi:SAM-dependent methyltransferase